jgi:hypothetical protein
VLVVLVAPVESHGLPAALALVARPVRLVLLSKV